MAFPDAQSYRLCIRDRGAPRQPGQRTRRVETQGSGLGPNLSDPRAGMLHHRSHLLEPPPVPQTRASGAQAPSPSPANHVTCAASGATLGRAAGFQAPGVRPGPKAGAGHSSQRDAGTGAGPRCSCRCRCPDCGLGLPQRGSLKGPRRPLPSAAPTRPEGAGPTFVGWNLIPGRARKQDWRRRAVHCHPARGVTEPASGDWPRPLRSGQYLDAPRHQNPFRL